MSDILEEILSVKRDEVASYQKVISVKKLQAKIEEMPSCRDFYQAMTKPNPRGLNVIAEVKRASPSAGVICNDFNPANIAQKYQRAGADAVSVLTDEQFFQGQLEHIQQVRQSVSLPVLRKDFIIDPYQVYQSRAAGADAILLIAEALAVEKVEELITLARSITLTVLLEVHEMESLTQVLPIIDSPTGDGCLLGINNRNLKTMKVDINQSIELSNLINNKKILVSESGIKERADVSRLIDANFNGILIGQTLMASPDIEAKFAQLFESQE